MSKKTFKFKVIDNIDNGSFNVQAEIWNPSQNRWQSEATGVLSCSPSSDKASDRNNAIFTVNADMKAVDRGGEAPSDQGGGQLRFKFSGDGSAWITFHAGRTKRKWYHDRSNQKEVDIDLGRRGDTISIYLED